MRQSVPAHVPIFRSEMQLRLLGLLLLDTDREWTIEALQRAVGAPRPSVHRELQRAVDAGIVVRDASMRPYRYRAAPASPAVAPLQELLRLTVGLESDLRDLLRGDLDIDFAVIHGSWAQGKTSPTSDVDVLVVGDADFDSLGRALARVGRRAGRQVDLTLLTRQEFARQHKRGSGFLGKIFDGPVIPLAGEPPAPPR